MVEFPKISPRPPESAPVTSCPEKTPHHEARYRPPVRRPRDASRTSATASPAIRTSLDIRKRVFRGLPCAATEGWWSGRCRQSRWIWRTSGARSTRWRRRRPRSRASAGPTFAATWSRPLPRQGCGRCSIPPSPAQARRELGRASQRRCRQGDQELGLLPFGAFGQFAPASAQGNRCRRRAALRCGARSRHAGAQYPAPAPQGLQNLEQAGGLAAGPRFAGGFASQQAGRIRPGALVRPARLLSAHFVAEKSLS